MRCKNSAKILSPALICLGLSSALSHAQPVPVQQFDENQQRRQLQDSLLSLAPGGTNAPELYTGENADVGPQHILRLNPRPTYFEALADSQYAFTDNDRLAHQNTTKTAYTVNTLQLAFAPQPMQLGPGIIAPRVGYRSQWYNYGLDGSGGGEDSLDFSAQTTFASVQYLLNQRWQFDAEFDYTRLLSQRNYHEFYVEQSPSVAVTRLFPFANNLLFALAWQCDYHFTRVQDFPGSPHNVNDRLDNTLSATLSYQVLGNLVVQPYYRFEETHYPRTSFDNDRNDYQQTVGAAVSYYFTRQIALRVFASGNFRSSDDPHTTSYEKFDTGLGATMIVRF